MTWGLVTLLSLRDPVPVFAVIHSICGLFAVVLVKEGILILRSTDDIISE